MGRKSNKRTKGAWRKAEVSDVVDAVEKKNEEEAEDALVNTEEMFFVDTKGNVDSRKNRKRRERRIAPDSSDEEADDKATKRSKSRSKGSKLTAGARAAKAVQKNRKRFLARKGRLAAAAPEEPGSTDKHSEAKATPTTTPSTSQSKPEAVSKAPAALDKHVNLDIWGTKKAKRVSVPVLAMKVARPLKAPKKKRSLHILESNILKAPLAVAKPGQSYNPNSEEYNKVLSNAYEIHQEDRNRKREIALKLKRKHPSQKINYLNADGSDEEAEPALPPKVVRGEDRLTKAQRNKQKRQRALEQSHEERRKQKKLLGQLGELKKIVKSIDQEEHNRLQKRKRLHLLQMKTASLNPVDINEQGAKRTKLSKHSFEPAFPDLPLRAELKGSLLNLPHVGSIARDQFKRFEARNLMEVRKKQNPRARRYKLRTFNRFKAPVASESNGKRK